MNCGRENHDNMEIFIFITLNIFVTSLVVKIVMTPIYAVFYVLYVFAVIPIF